MDAAVIAVPSPARTGALTVVDNVMAGVVVAVATVPARPFMLTTDTDVTVPLVAGADETQVVPLLVRTLPEVLGATPVIGPVPPPSRTLCKGNVPAPVPPWLGRSVPLITTLPQNGVAGVRPVPPSVIELTTDWAGCPNAAVA
jgi:hypothetical protein